MTIKDDIFSALEAAFQPTQLDVIDESHQHQGHSGWREGGETHFRVKIVTNFFEGKSRLARHRAINEVLADQLANGVHALAIEAGGPGDSVRRSSA